MLFRSTLTFEAWATDAGNSVPPEIIDAFTMTRPVSGLVCGVPPGPDGVSPAADGEPPVPPGEPTLADGGDAFGGRLAVHGCGCGSSPAGLALAPILFVWLSRRRRCRRGSSSGAPSVWYAS